MFKAAQLELAKAKPELRGLGLLNPFNSEIFLQTPAELQPETLLPAISLTLLTGAGSSEQIQLFQAFVARHDELTEDVIELWINVLAASGDFTGLQRLADSGKSYAIMAGGCAAFLTGQHEAAQTAFDGLISKLRKTSGKRNVILPTFPGLMHLLLLLRKQDPKSRAELKVLSAAAQTLWSPSMRMIPELLWSAVSYADSPDATGKKELRSALKQIPKDAIPFVRAIAVHVAKWFLPEESFSWSNQLTAAAAAYEQLGLGWLAAWCEDAAAVCEQEEPNEKTPGQRHAQQGTSPMLSWIRTTSLWKRKLDSLRQMVDGTAAMANGVPVASGYDERMIWELEIVEYKGLCRTSLSPFIQKLSKGVWTKGRPVALQRLYQNHSGKEFAFLTDQDKAVCKCISESQVSTGYYRYTETVYGLDSDAALPALVGHPLIFTPGNRSQPLEIATRRPQLLIRKTKSGLQLQVDPLPNGEDEVVVRKDGAHAGSMKERSPRLSTPPPKKHSNCCWRLSR